MDVCEIVLDNKSYIVDYYDLHDGFLTLGNTYSKYLYDNGELWSKYCALANYNERTDIGNEIISKCKYVCCPNDINLIGLRINTNIIKIIVPIQIDIIKNVDGYWKDIDDKLVEEIKRLERNVVTTNVKTPWWKFWKN